MFHQYLSFDGYNISRVDHPFNTKEMKLCVSTKSFFPCISDVPYFDRHSPCEITFQNSQYVDATSYKSPNQPVVNFKDSVSSLNVICDGFNSRLVGFLKVLQLLKLLIFL